MSFFVLNLIYVISIPIAKFSTKYSICQILAFNNFKRVILSTMSNRSPARFSLDDGQDDPMQWLCKAEKYFTLHKISESAK